MLKWEEKDWVKESQLSQMKIPRVIQLGDWRLILIFRNSCFSPYSCGSLWSLTSPCGASLLLCYFPPEPSSLGMPGALVWAGGTNCVTVTSSTTDQSSRLTPWLRGLRLEEAGWALSESQVQDILLTTDYWGALPTSSLPPTHPDTS